MLILYSVLTTGKNEKNLRNVFTDYVQLLL